MIVLKVTQTTEGPAIVLNDEAQQLLGDLSDGKVSMMMSENGDIVLATYDMSPEARRERGRAFLQRYKPTFEALAK